MPTCIPIYLIIYLIMLCNRQSIRWGICVSQMWSNRILNVCIIHIKYVISQEFIKCVNSFTCFGILFHILEFSCNIHYIYIIVAIRHMVLYTSDIGWFRWVNIVHETVCRQWFGVAQAVSWVAIRDNRLYYWWRPPVVTRAVGELDVRSWRRRMCICITG